MDQFKKNVKSFVQIDNEIKRLNTELKQLRDKKRKRQDWIVTYMKKNSLTDKDIKISDGKLQVCQSRRVTPMSKQFLRERIAAYLKNESEADRMIEYIYENRPITMKDDLRRRRK